MNDETPTVECSESKGWRKFALTCFASVASFVLVVMHLLSGESWVAVQTLILGIYGAANVMDKKLGGAG